MFVRNYLHQFVRDARAQKLRLFLTIFGIVWGSAAVTLMLAFGQGLHKQIVVNQKGLGDAIVIAWPMRTTKPWEGLPKGRRVRMTEEDVVILRQEVEEIDRISEEYESGGARVGWGRKTLAADVAGANEEFGEMRSLIAQEGGRWFNAQDLADRASRQCGYGIRPRRASARAPSCRGPRRAFPRGALPCPATPRW